MKKQISYIDIGETQYTSSSDWTCLKKLVNRKLIVASIFLLIANVIHCQEKKNILEGRLQIHLGGEFRFPNNTDSYNQFWTYLVSDDIGQLPQLQKPIRFDKLNNYYDYSSISIRLDYNFELSENFSLGVFVQNDKYKTARKKYYETDNWYGSGQAIAEESVELKHTSRIRPYVFGPSIKFRTSTEKSEFSIAYYYGLYNLFGSKYKLTYYNEFSGAHGPVYLISAVPFQNILVKFRGFNDAHKIEMKYIFKVDPDDLINPYLVFGYQRMIIRQIRYTVKNYDPTYLDEAKDFFELESDWWREYNEAEIGQVVIDDTRFSLDLSGFYFVVGFDFNINL